MNRTGLVSISFRKHTPEEILAAMQKSGLRYIEWGSDVHAPCGDLQAIENIVKLQQQYGVECCSYGTYFRLGITPLEELEHYITAAKALGTRVLRLWCGDKNSEDYSSEEKAKLFAVCKAAARIAEENDVIFCMECHNSTYTNRKEGAVELMQTVGSEHFRMYWQPNQFRTVEENIESAKQLAAYVVNLHVFNWEGNERYPLEDACDLWDQYMECFHGDMAMLLEFMPDDRLESLETEAQALQKIAAKAGEYPL